MHEQLSIARRIIRKVKHRAKVRGIPFEIDYTDLELPEVCPALGLRLNYFPPQGGCRDGATLDRKDSTKGYLKGNIQILSHHANNIKNSGTAEEIRLVAEFMKRSEETLH